MLGTYENMDDLTPDWDFLGSGMAYPQGSSPSQLMNVVQVSAVQGASALDLPTLPECNSDATSGGELCFFNMKQFYFYCISSRSWYRVLNDTTQHKNNKRLSS
jgi:hypothetical protein